MSGYFELFPRTVYSNTVCLDITRRVVVRSSIAGDSKAFAPYEVPSGERADQLADGYYGSPSREWMVNLSIGALDPYFDWYMSDVNFADFIVSKYGTLEEAAERIHHWEVEWYGGSEEISPASYSSLDDTVKKYYEPLFGQGTEILSYIRREDDVLCTTNMIVTVEVPESSFQEGERVRVYDTGTLEGSAQVAWANSTHLKLVHVQTGANVGLTITGVSSGEEELIVSRDYTSNTIPIDERPFWTPVAAIDWERDRNERKKNIRLIDAQYTMDLELEFATLLRGR